MSHKTHLLCAFGVSDCLLSAPLHYVPGKLVGDDSGLRAQRWTAKRRRQKPKRHSAQAEHLFRRALRLQIPGPWGAWAQRGPCSWAS